MAETHRNFFQFNCKAIAENNLCALFGSIELTHNIKIKKDNCVANKIVLPYHLEYF